MNVISGGGAAGDSKSIDADSSSLLTLSQAYLNTIDDLHLGIILDLPSTINYSPYGAKADYFSADQGADHTIAVGADTTATYSNPYYLMVDYEVENSPLVVVGTPSNTMKTGFKIKPYVNCKLLSITTGVGSTATIAYLYAANATTLLAQANITGNTAVFTPYSLTAGTFYYLLVDKGGAAYAICNQSPYGGYPAAGSQIEWTTGYISGDDNSQTLSIQSAEFSLSPAPTSTKITTVAITSLDNAAGWQFARLHLPSNYCNIPSGASITYDIAPTGGAFTYAGISPESWYGFGALVPFSGAMIRINLNYGTAVPPSTLALSGYVFRVV